LKKKATKMSSEKEEGGETAGARERSPSLKGEPVVEPLQCFKSRGERGGNKNRREAGGER